MAKQRLSLNSLKLFRILFHFAFFHSITTFSLVDTKRQTGTYIVVKEKIVLKEHYSWQNGEIVNFPLIQNCVFLHCNDILNRYHIKSLIRINLTTVY